MKGEADSEKKIVVPKDPGRGLGLLGLEEVEEAIRELATLKERQKLREELEAAKKELEEKRQQDEVLRKRLYEDAYPIFFFNLLSNLEAVSNRTFWDVKKDVDDLHFKFSSIASLRSGRRERSREEEALEALIKTSKSLRKTLIKCFREMTEYLESLEG